MKSSNCCIYSPLKGYFTVFSSPVQIYRKSYCTTPRSSVGVGGSGGVGVDKIFKFFTVVGKALSDELSCMWTGLVQLVLKSLEITGIVLS